jgi:hypothetical protein
MNITNVYFKAVEENDSNYFLNKGAELYNQGKYNEAIEYYEIAAIMNNAQAINNLGYCYLYGRGISKDEKKAILYFEIAAKQNNIDALYKIGTFYLSGTVVEKDNNLALYFLNRATDEILEQKREIIEFPSLCYTLANEYMKDIDNYSLIEIYDLLINAKDGYEYEIEENGATYYQKNYDEVLKMLENPKFEEFKDEDDEYDE